MGYPMGWDICGIFHKYPIAMRQQYGNMATC